MYSKSKFAGLTLLEVIFSITTLFSLVMLSAGLLFQSLNAQSKSSHQACATFLAERVLQRAKLAGPPNWGLDNVGDIQSRNLAVTDEGIEVEFHYRLLATPLAEPEADTSMGILYLLETEVWWTDSPDNSVAQTGKTSVKACSVHYLESASNAL